MPRKAKIDNEVEETAVEEAVAEKVCEKTQEEKDLERYEALYIELKELGISRISDLENLIANTKQKIK
jgi:hypothetical protein